jgi:penicillin-binding protein 1A
MRQNKRSIFSRERYNVNNKNLLFQNQLEPMFKRLIFLLLFLGISGTAVGVLVGTLVFVVAYPRLPSVDVLAEYKPKLPLRIYDKRANLIGQFGEEQRLFVSIEKVPEALKLAIIAAEDERFFEHNGIDFLGIGRAALANVVAGGARQGASTITMQVARNFFLSSEKTFARKLNEALLAIKIERNLSKQQILELYINQIYLGQRAYGFGAASDVYFGNELEAASLAELAMLAGLPKAPSKFNPVVNFKRAKQRQLYVLNRMLTLGFISETDFELASKEKLKIEARENPSKHAEFFVEMVRQELSNNPDMYGSDLYTRGLKVYTTLSLKHQQAAYDAVTKGLEDHDRRQGYRRPSQHFRLTKLVSDEDLEELLSDFEKTGELYPAIVLESRIDSLKVYVKSEGDKTLTGPDLDFLFEANSEDPQNIVLKRGDLVYAKKVEEKKVRWELSQMPAAEGALVSINPEDGAILALVGGYNFYKNKFNHATQSMRQPGSSFKPFIYSAALERGLTPASIIDDAPIEIPESQTGFQIWEPKNYDDEYDGPISLRYALKKSKNLVAIRILETITPEFARDYITKFGFERKDHPPYLTMALGAGSTSPLILARAYSVFANGGFLVKPYSITRVVEFDENSGEKEIYSHYTEQGDYTDPYTRPVETIDERNAFTMNSMLADVIESGTGVRAKELGRGDLRGKTGTTNDNVDAWFAGYQKNLVAIAWVGKDQPGSLGAKETGSRAALPIWLGYMRKVLGDYPEDNSIDIPYGITKILIDPSTGLPTKDQSIGIEEYIYDENNLEKPGAFGAFPFF